MLKSVPTPSDRKPKLCRSQNPANFAFIAREGPATSNGVCIPRPSCVCVLDCFGLRLARQGPTCPMPQLPLRFRTTVSTWPQPLGTNDTSGLPAGIFAQAQFGEKLELLAEAKSQDLSCLIPASGIDSDRVCPAVRLSPCFFI